MARRHRLRHEYIQHGPAKCAGIQRITQRVLIQQRAAADIDHAGTGRQQADAAAIEQAAGLCGQRRGQHDEIGVRQCSVQPRRVDHANAGRMRRGDGPHAGYHDTRRRRARRDGRAQHAQSHHQQPPPGQHAAMDGPGPLPRPLRRSIGGQLIGQHQQGHQPVLTGLFTVGATIIQQLHPGRQPRERGQAIQSGGGAVDQSQVRRGRQRQRAAECAGHRHQRLGL